MDGESVTAVTFAVVQFEHTFRVHHSRIVSSAAGSRQIDRPVRLLPTLTEACFTMPANQILQEAGKLHKVSENLDALAKREPPAAEELAIMARTIRNSAMLLEVVVALRIGPELDEKTN